MVLNTLTIIILELNAAVDSRNYDDITVEEANQHIEAEDVVEWLSGRVPEADLSLLTPDLRKEYHSGLAELRATYAGDERDQWGVQNRGLCLLIAWTNELVQQQRWVPNS